VEPELNRRRAAFDLRQDRRDLELGEDQGAGKGRAFFVELGEYLCEVRSKQYWRLERLKSFDDFLAKRFPDSRRKAYYLMAIHENLNADSETAASRGGLEQSDGVGQSGEERWGTIRLCNLVAQSQGNYPRKGFKRRSGTTSDRQRNGALGDSLLQGL